MREGGEIAGGDLRGLVKRPGPQRRHAIPTRWEGRGEDIGGSCPQGRPSPGHGCLSHVPSKRSDSRQTC